ncbi:hypothetical protein [Peribacillus frigoritolerans]|uniref:hypothetical protein n=1 Tax=Peribacillus frigoritolerans TaxID=450367 RepID=UPI0020797715|nr:hypothetical protein [Peribacillus frigoritolerans]USK77833.1 hypothetical protein LIT31_26265 [Peribacillus frigoritolerans]
MDYIDPIPPVLNLLKNGLSVRVYGNRFPAKAVVPSVLVRVSGGTDYTRLQLIARADTDYEAMIHLLSATNYLSRNAAYIQGIKVYWIARESNPTHDFDEDTGKPEAWGYMRLEHLEA